VGRNSGARRRPRGFGWQVPRFLILSETTFFSFSWSGSGIGARSIEGVENPKFDKPPQRRQPIPGSAPPAGVLGLELLGHSEVITPMIREHVPNRGGGGVRGGCSPADTL